MDHKLKYPACAPKYKDFDGARKYQIERTIVEDIPHVPDREKTRLLEGVDMDRSRIDLDQVNFKNEKILGSVNNRTHSTLD